MKRYATAKIEGLFRRNWSLSATTSAIRIRLLQVILPWQTELLWWVVMRCRLVLLRVSVQGSTFLLLVKTISFGRWAPIIGTRLTTTKRQLHLITRCTNRFQSTDCVPLVSVQQSTSLWTIHSSSCSRFGRYEWYKVRQRCQRSTWSIRRRIGETSYWKEAMGCWFSNAYRVGELNYIPVILYNKTSANNKWGTEALFPARVHVRRTINPRNMVFLGYELQGQSFRMYENLPGFDIRDEDLKPREIRVRAVYEFSLKDFIWMSIQGTASTTVTMLIAWYLDHIYRAFGLIDGTPAYAQMNGLTNPFYVNISVNLVSP